MKPIVSRSSKLVGGNGVMGLNGVRSIEGYKADGIHVIQVDNSTNDSDN